MFYTARKIEEVKRGHWSHHEKIGVFEIEKEGDVGGKLVGSYVRNYYTLYRTFFPFNPFNMENGWYALYSPDYTSTRIMKLPECTDLGGEERDEWGFCPVEYFVPQVRLHNGKGTGEIVFAPFGFVAGCVWGDDISWKIQFLDLRRAVEGVLKRDDRMGYIALPSDKYLKDVVEEVWMEDNDFSFDITASIQYSYAWNEETREKEGGRET